MGRNSVWYKRQQIYLHYDNIIYVWLPASEKMFSAVVPCCAAIRNLTLATLVASQYHLLINFLPHNAISISSGSCEASIVSSHGTLNDDLEKLPERNEMSMGLRAVREEIYSLRRMCGGCGSWLSYDVVCKLIYIKISPKVDMWSHTLPSGYVQHTSHWSRVSSTSCFELEPQILPSPLFATSITLFPNYSFLPSSSICSLSYASCFVCILHQVYIGVRL